ncbi:hypothetical protein BJX70DRAFT_360727 [Aspergillus crustosus]
MLLVQKREQRITSELPKMTVDCKRCAIESCIEGHARIYRALLAEGTEPVSLCPEPLSFEISFSSKNDVAGCFDSSFQREAFFGASL